MVKLHDIEWCPTPLTKPCSDPELEQEVKKLTGRVSYATRYLASVPWIVRALAIFDSEHVYTIPENLSHLIGLVVSMENSCRYCYGAGRALLKFVGFKERVIRKLEEDIYKTDFSEKEKAVMDFARKISRADPRVSMEDFKKLEDLGYSKRQITEIVYITAKTIFYNRIGTLSALPPDPMESFVENPLIKIISPIMSFFFRLGHSGPKEYTTVEFTNHGLGKNVIHLLKGLPGAYNLRTLIDRALASEVVSRRTKALTGYIISRALGCPACEPEFADMLKNEGFSDTDLNDIAMYLTCDQFSVFENKLVQFARDTVRYKPIEIQYKARELCDYVSTAEVLAICGFAGIANTLGRLTMLIHYLKQG